MLAHAQEEVIRIDTALVSVPVTVSDRDGRYLTNLKKEDFQLFEDNVEQEIALFEPTERPFTALLLFDTSGSMSKYLENSASAATAFIKQLRPEDTIIIATFNDRSKINIRLQATKKRDLKPPGFILAADLPRSLPAYTTTFDAVEDGIKYMKDFPGRRAILLFADGEQYGKDASAKSNLRDAEEQEALIYTIRFGDYSIGRFFKNANNYMQSLAQKTGGRAYQITDITDLKKMFLSVVEELGKQYHLGYYPKNPPKAGQKRKIKVKTNQTNLVVRSRIDYVVGSSKDAKQK
jgi:VWFA-related protein